MDWTKQIVRFVVLLLLQVLLVNNLQFLGVCHPYIYLLGLLALPLVLPRWADMLIGVGVGLLMDVFCNSLGVHTAACVMVMYMRPYLVNRYVTDMDRFNKEVSIGSIGLLNYVLYTSFLIVLHHTMVFYLTAWSVQHFWFTLLEVVVSSVVTFVLIMTYSLISEKR